MAISLSRLALLSDRLDALYCADSDGYLLCTNEWDRRPPPRFHLMRTEAGPMVRWGKGLPAGLIQHLQELCRLEPPSGWAHKLPIHYDRYVEALAAEGPITKMWSGPAYVLADDPQRDAAPVAIDVGNADLLSERFKDWALDVPHRQPFMAVVEGGHAASICASVRISTSVHCAGVETHPDCRQKGYALDAVAGWSRAVRSQGATPFYSTSWENLASQRIAARLGFELAAVDFHIS